MKIALSLYLLLLLSGYKIGIPVSERALDEKDCEMWKYEQPETYRWCMFENKPELEIIREIE